MRVRGTPTVIAVALVCALLCESPSTPARAAPAAPAAVPPTVQEVALLGVDNAALRDNSAPENTNPTGRAGSSGATSPKGPAPEVLTARLDTQPFDLVGLVWAAGSAPAGGTVQVRVRARSGWSDWYALEMADGGPDAGSPDAQRAGRRGSTEPLFVEAADGLQVRVDTPDGAHPQQLRAVLVDPGESEADQSLSATSTLLSPASSGESVIPRIIPRAGWGADERLRTCTPETNSSVDMAFVHHTVNTNSYTADQVPALIRSMYAYHVQGRGWCDIGYNFLVDRFGRIFEGRAGGIRLGIVGAHTQGFNSLSVGVSMIGEFSDVAPSAQMLAAVGHVVGWKLAMYDRNPQGVTTVVSGGSSRFPAGTAVRLNVVSGHRDAALTACPGDTGYARLPSIRATAANWAYLETHSPGGRVESAGEGNNGVRVVGWALDPDVTSSIQLVIKVDGRSYLGLANRNRPDIGEAFPGYGNAHGFDITLPAPPGGHAVCVYAVNVGPGASTPFPCRPVIVKNHNPFGHLDTAVGIPGGIRVSGWTIDPDTAASISSWVDVSGSGGAVEANAPRSDVGRAYPTFGEQHGFAATISKPPGTYRVCASGINVGWGADASIGCRTVTVYRG